MQSGPCGSAGGPDGLRPNHLKEMIGPSATGGRGVLLPALASFVQLVLEGKTPPSIHPYFFGANLVSLRKKDDGIRPIAVGCSLRRLSGKVAGSQIIEGVSDLDS